MPELAVLKRWLYLAILLGSFLLTLWLKAPAIAVDPNPVPNSVERGITAYESGQFAEAIAQWQTAMPQTDSPLTTAYLLSNIAIAQQQLGQNQQAGETIGQALNITQNWPDQDQAYWEVSARVLNTLGQTQWQQGQLQPAYTTWQQAESHYRQVKPGNATTSLSGTGLIRAQINQALALQELGLNARAVKKLAQIETQVDGLPLELQASAAKALGSALRQVGELTAAADVLSRAQAADVTASKAGLEIQLERGHTLRSLSHRAIASGDVVQAKDYAEQALADYETVAQRDSTPTLATQATLNQISYLIEIGEPEKVLDLQSTLDLAALSVSQTSVESYISQAHSLICLQAPSFACTKREWQEISTANSSQTASPQRWSTIADLLATAIHQARSLQNPVLESYAIGELGHLYELTGQSSEAIDLTEKAIALLEGRQLPEATYLWQWQLGRIYRSEARDEQAISAYQQATDSLSTVRQNLVLIDSQAQFSFIDNVEPVYRELVSLLLDRPATEVAQRSLALATQTIDALQLTELENFLGCNLSALINLGEPGTDPNAVKIYPIVLPEKLAIIVDVPNQPLALRTIDVPQSTVDSTLKALRSSLTLPGKTPEVLASASQLHSWLINPLLPILDANPQIETLVFVPDGLLRNIPMGVLYDGEQYLIEKDYAIAIAPQLALFAPATNTNPLKILRGGVGLAQTIRGQQFPTIDLLQTELEQIPDQFTVAPPLLNESFTQANLEEQLATQKYSALHWKTHGVFSSMPAETFLVAYQEGITANELSDLVRIASEQQAEPLELVVLSACETAQGDRRAVLGLAGIAVRAGARSTLSTLWRADDRANTQLMDGFYQGLQAGLNKAQALQAAQKSLLLEEGYPAPYFWAPYVLVGNWL